LRVSLPQQINRLFAFEVGVSAVGLTEVKVKV